MSALDGPDPTTPDSATPTPLAPPPPRDRLTEQRRAEADASTEAFLRQGRIRACYRRAVEELVRFHVPADCAVLELGCGVGDLLATLKPSRGVGVDHSARRIAVARGRHPQLDFHVGDASEYRPEPGEHFDYIVLANLVGELVDVQRTLSHVRALCSPDTRVVVTFYNYLWQPAVTLATWLGLKPRQAPSNWLTPEQLANLCELADLDVVTTGRHLLLPLPIPGLAALANRWIGPLPGINGLCLNEYVIARPRAGQPVPRTVSVIVPCKNERGNVAETIASVPAMGRGTEILFVDGHSTDGTVEEIQRCAGLNPAIERVRVLVQDGRGKADAVRKGFNAAQGEVLMILDADNTVRGEELPKFYEALVSGKGDLINGSRLVFPMEKQAMRHLNLLANHFFGRVFSWILAQEVSDTLCGSKVLFRSDWLRLEALRGQFGRDPFGDFDLLFAAARSNLKIREVPIRYRARDYGEIKIERFRNGFELLLMAGRAFRIFKQI